MSTTLWYAGNKYNEVRVMEKLADIIIENSGRVEIRADDVLIKARGLRGKISEKERWLQRIEEKGCATESLKAEIEDLKEKERNFPVIQSRFCSKYTLGSGWIKFVLDDYYYYFSFADNPFSGDTYTKIKLNDNTYVGKYYMEVIEEKRYYFDEMWTACAKQTTIDEIANMLFETLKNAKVSERIIKRKKVRVPNTHNDRYHYETITEIDQTMYTIKF